MNLEPGAVHNLVVDTQLLAVVVEDEHADAATAVVERVLETVKQVALVKDRQALLDVASLGHADDVAVLADVKDAVLLEDGTEHVLHKHRRRRVGDEGRLFIELLGEEVNAQVAVLPSLRRGGDADHLARAALEDDQVTDADVVAWDGDGIGRHAALIAGVDGRWWLVLSTGRAGSGTGNRCRGDLFVYNDLLSVGALVVVMSSVVVAIVVMMVVSSVDGVQDTVGGAVQPVT